MRTENGLCKEQCARANWQNTVAASLDARCTSLWLPDQSQYNAASHHTHQPTGTLHAWLFLELSKALTSDTNHDSDSIRTTVTQVEGTRLCLHASAMPACPSPNSRDHTHTHTHTHARSTPCTYAKPTCTYATPTPFTLERPVLTHVHALTSPLCCMMPGTCCYSCSSLAREHCPPTANVSPDTPAGKPIPLTPCQILARAHPAKSLRPHSPYLGEAPDFELAHISFHWSRPNQ
jgi:hypothetical protein